MDSQARHELSRAIQREGVVLFENPQRIKALLMDACPESRMEIGLLVQAAEDDIPARLARSSESVFRDSEIARAVADLKKARRLDDGAAEWVVRSWAWALGVLGTEPSDDVGDETSVTSTPRSPSDGQAGSPPYPSAPPSGPGDTTSFPPTGAPRSEPGPYSEPWQSGVTSGGQSVSPGSGGLSWGSLPPGQGTSAGFGGGLSPPVAGGWGAALPPPPSGRGRGWLFAVLGAVVAVIVLAVVGVVIIQTSTPSVASPAPTGAAPTETGQGTIKFTITDSLDSSLEVAETTTVYSFGKEVGNFQLNRSHPNGSIPMVTHGTNVDYQLEVTLVATNGKQYTFTGTGAIAVYEGAVYAVAVSEDSAGNFTATLEPQQHGA